MNKRPTVGVLALQGAFDAHLAHLDTLGVNGRLVRSQEDLQSLDGLIFPGGESTTMSNLLNSANLVQPISHLLASGLPVFGTCAGMILLASSVIGGRTDQTSFGLLDIAVHRNGYGRQLDSFEQEIDVTSFESPFHGVFIRAPIITSVGANVEVLACSDSIPVLVKQENILAASFHPELVDDRRIHEIFISFLEKE